MSYYKESLLKQAAFPAAQEASSSSIPTVEPYTDSNGELWIKSFIINSRPNKRGWQVDADTLPDRIKTIIGKPLVIDRDPLTGKIDHPKYYTWKSKEANLEAQKKKAIGVVENVYYDPNTDAYYAHSRVTDQKARDFILANWDKKLAVSPQLIYNPRTEQPNFYRDYELTHLAVVSGGAYGPSAVMVGKCTGTGEVCKKELEAIAAASASASSTSEKDKKKAASASELMRSGYIFTLTGLSLPTPPNGKRRGTLA